MTKPYFLMGATLIFWGFITENILIGFLAAIILELSYLVKRKIDFTLESYIRIADLTSVIFIGSIFIIYFNFEIQELLQTFTKWMPMIFIILMATQMYSVKNCVIIGTKLGKKEYAHQPMNIFYPYILLTLFSTTTINNRKDYYFYLLFILIAWSFFQFRNRRYSKITYILLTCIFLITGYFGQKYTAIGYNYLRDRAIYNYQGNFYDKWIRMISGTIPFEGVTAMGDLGELKLSGKILFRVELLKNAKTGSTPLYRIKDSTYDIFSPPNWNKGRKKFFELQPDEEDNWTLQKKEITEEDYCIKIDQTLSNKKGLIPLPKGSYRIEKLVGILERDLYGTVRISEAGRSIGYKVWYNPKYEDGMNPRNADHSIAGIEKDVTERVAKELGLRNSEPSEAIRKVEKYFDDNFKYTLRLERRRHKSYLHDFLIERKAGHCEYFATATVLLLREAGIPSRYVTGYVLQEKSAYNKNIFIVRERHGHAWAEAFVNGKWITVDNTPSVWLNEDEKNASSIEPIADFFEYVIYEIRNFLTNRTERTNQLISIGVIFLILIFLVRIYLKQRGKGKEKKVKKMGREKVFKVIESDFRLIHEEIDRIGIPRMGYETFFMWVKRIDSILEKSQNENNTKLLTNDLIPLINNYNQLRFDPKSLSDDELNSFNYEVKNWLEKWKNLSKNMKFTK